MHVDNLVWGTRSTTNQPQGLEYPVLRHGVVALEILHDNECRNTERDDTTTLNNIQIFRYLTKF